MSGEDEQHEQHGEAGLSEGWNMHGEEAHKNHDEAVEHQQHDMMFSNRKRTSDTYQQIDLDHNRNLNAVALQAVQNAVTAQHNMNTQAQDHRDHAHNKIWNLNETDRLAAGTDTSISSIAAIVVKVLAEMNKDK